MYDINRATGKPAPTLAQIALSFAVFGIGVYLMPSKWAGAFVLLVFFGILAVNAEQVDGLLSKIGNALSPLGKRGGDFAGTLPPATTIPPAMPF